MFTVRFMGVTNVRGTFRQVDGTIMLADDPTRSSVTAIIGVASINTNNQQRDKDLQNAAFFDAEHYPTILFRSSRIQRTGGGLALTGQLTMRGVTREVTIPLQEMHGKTRDAWGNTRVGFQGEVTLSRKDYGILGTQFWNSEFDPGRMSIGDSVRIELAIEGTQPNLDKWTTPLADSLVRAIGARGVGPVLAEYRVAAGSDSTLRRASQVMLINTGRKLSYHQQGEAAIQVFRLAAELNPRSPEPLAWLGEAQRTAGQTGEAAKSFAQALALDPTHPAALEGGRVTGSR
jgi:polyisoprenoid-binding protein YceI